MKDLHQLREARTRLTSGIWHKLFTDEYLTSEVWDRVMDVLYDPLLFVVPAADVREELEDEE